ncbi:MAG: hypothetical protein ACUZ8E_08355 [Candidatus Anammoxibacter sp.]
MTKLLEQAVKKAKDLPDSEQDAIASIILEELEDEARWEDKFSASKDTLAKLASEAMEEEGRGETQELDPDSL